MTEQSAAEGLAEEQLRRRRFVEAHRTAIYGYTRPNAGPSMSVVYYHLKDKALVVSTMRARAKARAAVRDPEVALCVLDEQWPLSYVLVYCRATIEDDFEAVIEAMMKVRAIMAGEPMPESIRPVVEETARREDRVVLRLHPYKTFATPPRHVYRPEDNIGLRHDLGRALPWAGGI